ncbi:MAG: hypothetical protein ACE5DQ_01085, partial [Candidatus Paceibacterota bacterium]
GLVWCVNVPNSYFVAKRNNKIFITGNSGFPKAYDISKGFDKKAGAKRKVRRTLGAIRDTYNTIRKE